MERQQAADWINRLQLQPHPEGGHFREVYRSTEKIQTKNNQRSASTSIYFLLCANEVSAFHRLQADELWHFYSGSSLTVHCLTPTGQYEQRLLGQNWERGEAFQLWVPAGWWFGATVESDYALVGCTVAPGFEFHDFEMAQRETLLQQYPQHRSIIQKLTR